MQSSTSRQTVQGETVSDVPRTMRDVAENCNTSHPGCATIWNTDLRQLYRNLIAGTLSTDQLQSFCRCDSHIIINEHVGLLGIGGSVLGWFTSYFSGRIKTVRCGMSACLLLLPQPYCVECHSDQSKDRYCS